MPTFQTSLLLLLYYQGSPKSTSPWTTLESTVPLWDAQILQVTIIVLKITLYQLWVYKFSLQHPCMAEGSTLGHLAVESSLQDIYTILYKRIINIQNPTCSLMNFLYLVFNPHMFSYHTPLLLQKAVKISGASLTAGPEFKTLMEHWVTRMMGAGSCCIFSLICFFTTSILAWCAYRNFNCIMAFYRAATCRPGEWFYLLY